MNSVARRSVANLLRADSDNLNDLRYYLTPSTFSPAKKLEH